jgi:ferrochelatase
MSAGPFDAFLLVSFGGPEGPDDVMPFLQNVTRGRDVPPERLAEVAEHYQRFGGVSPINAHCRELLGALEADFAVNGIDMPIYWGNRNWTPSLRDAIQQMADDGRRRALVFTTSAYASYPGCRQYREDVFAAKSGIAKAPAFARIRHDFNHPGFIRPMIANTVAALDGLPEHLRADATVLFTTHSLPMALAYSAGPEGGLYVTQHNEVAGLVLDGVTEATGVEHPAELVYQSRSGPPTVKWLEPDIGTRLSELAEAGVSAIVVVPIGFTSDHMEVVYDLDVEVREQAEKLGVAYARAATVGANPEFVTAVRELVLERAESRRPDLREALGELGVSYDLCPPGCCPNPNGPRPAVAGRD